MPANLSTTEKLFKKHSSKPYNPKLANVFFKSGMIEAWGRGFDKIREACEKYKGPLPEYDINEDGIMVCCQACDKYKNLLLSRTNSNSIINNERIMSEKVSELKKEPIVKLLEYLKTNDTITTAIGVEITGKSEAQVRRYLKVLCETGILKGAGTTRGKIYSKS